MFEEAVPIFSTDFRLTNNINQFDTDVAFDGTNFFVVSPSRVRPTPESNGGLRDDRPVSCDLFGQETPALRAFVR